MKKIIYLFIALSFIYTSCVEKKYEPVSSDGTAPGVVKNVSFEPIAGGVIISYDIPTDSDLLYVKAVYTNSHGIESEVRSSMYTNTIKIEGFGDVEPKKVNLYCVDRGENISAPVAVTVTPNEPAVNTMKNDFTITPDFGGAKFSWLNPDKTPIVVMLYAEDTLGRFVNVHNVYTSMDTAKYSIRGMKPKAAKFGAVIRDRWDNFSDTIFPSGDKKLIPLKEDKLDKSLIRKVILANDDNWDAWEGDYWNCFDDDRSTIVHTQGDHPRPSIMTIDFGAEVTLSRFILYQREGWPFTHGNPKIYDVYGSLDLPGQDGNLEDWTLLKKCVAYKPSGLPLGQNTDEDLVHFNNGDEFTFDEQIKIRYFRLVVHETWDGAGYIDFGEMTFYGQTNKIIE